MANKDFQWFSDTFRDSIRVIGHVLLVMSPWNNPLPISRAWYLFEIANSINDPVVKFSIRLPKSEVKEMSTAVIDDSDCLIQVLSDIQAENTDATSLDDLMLIFDVIRKSPG